MRPKLQKGAVSGVAVDDRCDGAGDVAWLLHAQHDDGLSLRPLQQMRHLNTHNKTGLRQRNKADVRRCSQGNGTVMYVWLVTVRWHSVTCVDVMFSILLPMHSGDS